MTLVRPALRRLRLPHLPGRRWIALLPPVDVDGPRVRLGVAWAAITVVALVAGPVATAVVFAAVALAAAGQTARSWRGAERRPFRPVAVGGATVCALAGAVGPLAVVVAATVAGVAAVLVERVGVAGVRWDARSTAAIAVGVGVAAASPALAVGQLGLVAAFVLLALVHVVDASTFIVGSGAASRWEGPVAGLASAGAFGLAVAAVFVPPFRGASPWVLAAVVALLVPVGGVVASMLLGPAGGGRVPALRRLDALLATGPVWVLLGRLLLDLG